MNFPRITKFNKKLQNGQFQVVHFPRFPRLQRHYYYITYLLSFKLRLKRFIKILILFKNTVPVGRIEIVHNYNNVLLFVFTLFFSFLSHKVHKNTHLTQ